MKTSSILVLGMTALALATAGACGGQSTSRGQLVLGLKDGPPTSSDGRTISKLEIDVTKIELKTEGASQADAGESDDKDVVVFDAGTGAAHTVDLLTVTTFSEIVANLAVPAGTYEGAELAVSGARVVFADAPTVSVPLTLDGDGHSKAEFRFHFKPNAVVVSATSTTLAVVDFIPVVVKDAAGQYRLGHDGDNDKSGEADEHEHELEIKGNIATIDLAANKLTLSGANISAVDFTNAAIEMNDATATKSALAVGQRIEAEGKLDKATGVLVATKLHVE